jgi:hypothetical protein
LQRGSIISDISMFCEDDAEQVAREMGYMARVNRKRP